MGAGVMVHPAEEKHAAGRGVCVGQKGSDAQAVGSPCLDSIRPEPDFPGPKGLSQQP